MQHNLPGRERRAKRPKIEAHQWIDNIIALWPGSLIPLDGSVMQARAGITDPGYNIDGRQANLHQTKFLPITMQAIRFGIDRDTIDSFEFLEQLLKLSGFRDHFNPAVGAVAAATANQMVTPAREDTRLYSVSQSHFAENDE